MYNRVSIKVSVRFQFLVVQELQSMAPQHITLLYEATEHITKITM